MAQTDDGYTLRLICRVTNMAGAYGWREKMRVMARAYGDEPLDRSVAAEANGLAYLINLSVRDSDGTYGRGGVGFPRNSIFEFDQTLFDSLLRAFSSHDEAQLASLWKRATPKYRQ
jgi:hypothetical protein